MLNQGREILKSARTGTRRGGRETADEFGSAIRLKSGKSYDFCNDIQNRCQSRRRTKMPEEKCGVETAIRRDKYIFAA